MQLKKTATQAQKQRRDAKIKSRKEVDLTPGAKFVRRWWKRQPWTNK